MSLYVISIAIKGFIVGSVWRLKVTWFYKSIIILVAIYAALIGLVWFLILLWLDKKENKKK